MSADDPNAGLMTVHWKGGLRVVGLNVLATGTHVAKVNGYPFPGEVRAAFVNRAGQLRYVVESVDLPGLLHIFSPEQLEETP